MNLYNAIGGISMLAIDARASMASAASSFTPSPAPNRMSPIVELLQEMRPRIAMYLGENSVIKLAAFLRGYEQAAAKFGVGPPDHFLGEFQDWVTRRFSISISKSWEDIIAFHSADNDEAMKYFWELLDEYLAENTLKG